MAFIKILGGDFAGGHLIYTKAGWAQQPAFVIDSEVKLARDLIEKIEIQTEEQAQRTYSVLTGMAGALVLGPLGLIFGAGKTKGQVCFAAYFRDGRKFLAVTDTQVFQELSGAVFSGPSPAGQEKVDPWVGPKAAALILGIGIPLVAIIKAC